MRRTDPENILTGEALYAWRDFVRGHTEAKHSERTIESYGEGVALLAWHLQETAAGTTAVTASREQVSDFLIATGGAHTPATQHNRHRALVQWFKFLVLEDIIGASPMTKIKACAPGYRIPAVLTDDQLRALLAACAGKALADLRDTAIIRLWCEPGSPRVSEMAGLAIADVDLKFDVARLDGKTGQRVIKMSPGTARAVSRYLRARARHRLAAELPALWLGTKGAITRSGLGQMLDRRGEAAGIGHVYPHQLRHTAFADFDAATGNANHAMALFGWNSSAMYHHYGKATRHTRALAAAAELNRAGRL
jgi:site-specific recombinase XerD